MASNIDSTEPVRAGNPTAVNPHGATVPFGYLCPDDFGAVGNGRKEDREALVDCFTAAQAQGKHVWLRPNAVYAIDNPQIILGGEDTGQGWNDWILMGNNATIKRHPDWSFTDNPNTVADILMIWRNCHRFKIYDLTIDGNRSIMPPGNHEFDHNIQIRDNCQSFVFVNCNFNNACGDGMYLAARGVNSTIPANQPYDGTWINCVFDNNYRQGATAEYCHRMKFIGCTFSNTNGTNPSAGFDIEPISDQNGIFQGDEMILFDSCIFHNNAHYGLMLGTHGEWIINDIKVANCVFDNNGNQEFTEREAQGRNNRAAMLIAGYNVTVVGCAFINHVNGASTYQTSKPLIAFKDASRNGVDPRVARGTIIANNTFRNNTACTHCIASRRVIDDAWEWRYPTIIEGNYMDLTGMSSAPGDGATQEDHIAAAISWQYGEAVIRGNSIKGDGSQEGIRIATTAGSSGARNNIIDDNRIEGCSVGIRLPGAGNPQHSVRGNVLVDCSTAIADGGGGARRLSDNLNI